MKFKYLGTNPYMIAFGHDFSGGATPDVTDERAIKKLSGNREFAAVGDSSAAEPDKAEPDKAEKPHGRQKQS